MTLNECYQQLGSNYTEVIERLHNEPFIHRCILKFMQDRNFEKLQNAISAGDCDTAFRAAHTFKSLCHTLSFSHLSPVIDELTERLRSGQLQQAVPFWEQLKPEYERTMELLRQYQETAAKC